MVIHYHKQVVAGRYSAICIYWCMQYQQYMHILELENITIFINGKK